MRVASDVLSLWNEALVFFTAEQSRKVIVQPSASIVTSVYDNSIFLTIFVAQQFFIYLAETWTIHAFYMDISNAATGKFVYHTTVSVYPTLVEQCTLFSATDGLYMHIETLAGSRIVDGYQNLLACLAFQQREVIHISLDSLSVNFFNDTTRGDITLLYGKRTLCHDFLDADSVSLVSVIKEHPEVGGREGRTSGIVTGTGMRSVQFTQHFAQQFLEIIVVVDAWEKTAICVTIAFPVDSMNIFHIEFVFDLLPSMVEDVLAFLCRLVIEDCFKIYIFGFAILYGYFLNASTTAHIEILSFLVRNHHTVANVLHH